MVGEDEGTIIKEIEKAVSRANIVCDYKISFREAPSEGSRGFMPYTVSKDEPMVKKFIKSIVNVCQKEPIIEYLKA